MSERQSHWDDVYGRLEPEECSWYEAVPETSLGLIARAAATSRGHLIDVGGGASTLVDNLLTAGWSQLSVLDIASQAIEQAAARLGDRGAQVRWLVGDVLDFPFEPQGYDVWHDRAVFHFLTETGDRERYVVQLLRALKPGGHVVLSTFDAIGPERCSRLPVTRYTPESLHAALGGSAQFVPLEMARHVHETPAGRQQPFSYLLAQRRPGSGESASR